MKTCVFIIGTNCSGKSALARKLIERSGGIKEATKELTTCGNGVVGLAGKYAIDSNYGGVDSLNGTKQLEKILRAGFEFCEVIICEGSYMDTFGMNLTNAMFVAQKHLVVFLYATQEELAKRLKERSGGELTERITSKQQRVSRAAVKWNGIGVPVYCVDSGKVSLDREADTVIQLIEELSKIKL